MDVDFVVIRNVRNVHTSVKLIVILDQIVLRYLVKLKCVYSVNVDLDGYR